MSSIRTKQDVESWEETTGFTHWTAGALCIPPLKPGGMRPQLAVLVCPSCAKTAPAVPADEDATRGASSRQHSRVDSFCALVAIVVILTVLGFGIVAAMAIVA